MSSPMPFSAAAPQLDVRYAPPSSLAAALADPRLLGVLEFGARACPRQRPQSRAVR